MSNKGKQYNSSGGNKKQVKSQYNQANPNKEEFSHELGLASPSNKQSAGKAVTGINFAEIKKQVEQEGNSEEAAALTNMMEEFAQEAEVFSSNKQPTYGEVNTDPDLSSSKQQSEQASNGKNAESGFTKMVEEIADEIGLFQSDSKSSGKSRIGSEIAEIKNKILKPFKKD
jgi:hypothetical protein